MTVATRGQNRIISIYSTNQWALLNRKRRGSKPNSQTAVRVHQVIQEALLTRTMAHSQFSCHGFGRRVMADSYSIPIPRITPFSIPLECLGLRGFPKKATNAHEICLVLFVHPFHSKCVLHIEYGFIYHIHIHTPLSGESCLFWRNCAEDTSNASPSSSSPSSSSSSS